MLCYISNLPMSHTKTEDSRRILVKVILGCGAACLTGYRIQLLHFRGGLFTI